MEDVINLPLFKHPQLRLIHRVTSSEMHFSTEAREMLKIIDLASASLLFFFFHNQVNFFSLKPAFYDIKERLMFHLQWQNNILKYIYKDVLFSLKCTIF